VGSSEAHDEASETMIDPLHEVMVVTRDAFVPLPDMQIDHRPGWSQLTTPSFSAGSLNGITWAVLDEETADARIDEAIAGYRRLGLKFRWTVGPDSRPLDLPERLARKGLVRAEVRGMAAPTAGGPPLPPGVTVEEITSETVDLFDRVMAEGWEMDLGPLAGYHRALLAEPARTNRLFLARVDGQPAAVSTYVAFPRSAYLMGAVVLPPFRGRGVYRGLVGARLRHAAARGLTLATTQAREETSAPILERLGFETVVRFASFSG
jgi:GNAT superfamily N-acetyltransferase